MYIPLYKSQLDPNEKAPNVFGHIPRRLLRVSHSPLLLLITSIILIPVLFTLVVVNYHGDFFDGIDVVVAGGVAGHIQPYIDILNDITTEEPIIDESGMDVADNIKIPTEEESSIMTDTTEPPPGNHRLVILLPADESGSALCKVIFSIMATGYPSPVILNWKKNFGKKKAEKADIGGSHLAKITGTLEYLEAISQPGTHEGDRLEDDDLVVLADAYDVWWQLPPDVLIKRYHESNRLANERLAKEWGAPGKVPMQQTIIASVQKKCWPGREMGGNRHCNELPQSSARKDLYGKDTDIDPAMSSNKNNPVHNTRPRWLNSGTMMGPVGDMKRYMRRVKERMDQLLPDQPDLRSDQLVFGDVYGEQEVWRTLLRHRQKEFLYNDATKGLLESFEYKVGLDYSQQLFIPTVFEEVDGEMIRLNNETHIADQSRKLGIDPVRLKGIPEDIRSSAIPLKKVVDDTQHGALDWGDLPLYADYFSEAIPVAVHHNAHRDGLKKRRVWWWDRTWYFPYLRELVGAYLELPAELRPVATFATQGKEAVYWAPSSDMEKRKPRHFTPEARYMGLPELEFEALCRDPEEDAKSEHRWFDEVFRDGKGGLYRMG
ncbi:hypothetical protein G7Z17_g7800 [Cylindrodendrum hubeiense]|uniref:Uncharacterized protein n=1 Tax=Cylindrodendrum hubeiense TaxID=595255 RepID=A0A9P5H6H5_9HYPO|nr:hypothetical protein G7Z17_g7800 [Cylindrodendrum hubeiense]